MGEIETLAKMTQVPLGHWITPALAVFFTIAAFVLLGIIAFSFGIVNWRWEKGGIGDNPLAAIGFRDSEGNVYTLPIIKDRQDIMWDEIKKLEGVSHVCNPEKCVPLMGIKQQQQRNIHDINDFNKSIHSLSNLFFKKLNFIKSQNNVLLRAAVKNNQLAEADIPKEIDDGT